MTQTESPGNSASDGRWVPWDWAAALFLFLGTSAVVLWQNSRLAVLWDLSYILENSYRISLGDLPYRDFPFPYAPATFLIQALLIKLTGRVFFHHVLYCAIVGGLGTVLTWRILVHVLRGAMPAFRLVAFLLAAPLTVLGIYCVFPHPFYDPDCTFVILCGVLLLLQLGAQGLSATARISRGDRSHRSAFRETEYRARVSGNRGAGDRHSDRARRLATATSVRLRMAPGRDGRGPRRGDASPPLHRGPAKLLALDHPIRRIAPIAVSSRKCLRPFRIHCCCCGSRRLRPARFCYGATVAAAECFLCCPSRLMAAPFAWALCTCSWKTIPSERAERLLALWPVVLIVSLVFALWDARKGPSVARLLPFILIGDRARRFSLAAALGLDLRHLAAAGDPARRSFGGIVQAREEKIPRGRSNCWPVYRRYPCSFPADFTSRATSG